MKTAGRWQVPLLLCGLLYLSQSCPLPSPVRDAATLSWAPGYHLEFPFWHLVFTPFCSVADAITVLSFHHLLAALAVFLTAAFLIGGLRIGALSGLGLIVFLAWGAVIPRPMARLH